jgi:hypothetical protein
VVPFIELIAPLFNVLGYRLVVREVKKVKTNGSTSQRFAAIPNNCQSSDRLPNRTNLLSSLVHIWAQRSRKKLARTEKDLLYSKRRKTLHRR